MSKTNMCQITAGNSESPLAEDELQEVEKYYSAINLADPVAIMEYGLDVQKKLSELSEKMLSCIHSQDMDHIGDTLDATVAYLKEMEEENDRAVLSNDRKSKKIREKYRQAKENIDHLVDTLQRQQIQLMKNCALMSQLKHMHTVFFRELKLQMIAADRKANDCRMLFSQLQNKATASGLKQDALEVAKLSTQIDSLEKRIQALQLTKSVAVQTEALIHHVHSNQTMMAQRLQTILLEIIPVWEN